MDFLNKIKSGLKSIFSLDAESFSGGNQSDVSSQASVGPRTQSVLRGAKNLSREIAQDTLRSASRVQASVLNTTAGKINKRFNTSLPTDNRLDTNKNKLTQALFGKDEQISGLKQTTEEIRKNLPKGSVAYSLAPVAVYGGVTLDLMPGFGGNKSKIVDKIVTSKSAEKITSYLLDLGVNRGVADEIAPKLVTVSQPRDIAFLVKNAEIVSRIEKNTGVVVPAKMREAIGEQIASQRFQSEKDAETFFTSIVNEAALTAPKVQKLDVNYAPLQELAKNSKSQAEFITAVEKRFSAIQKAQTEGLEIKDIPTARALQQFQKETQETGRTLGDIFNITKKEQSALESPVKKTDIQKRIDKVVAPKTSPIKKTTPSKTGDTITSQANDTFSAFTKQLKELQKVGSAGFKRGLKEGKAVERIKAQDRLLRAINKVKNKELTAQGFKKEIRTYAKELPTTQRNKILASIKFENIKTEKDFFRVMFNIESETGRVLAKRESRGQYLEYLRLAKIVREKGLQAGTRKDILQKYGQKNLRAIKSALSKLGLETNGGRAKLEQRLKNADEELYNKITKEISNNNIKRMSSEELASVNNSLLERINTQKPVAKASDAEIEKMKVGGVEPGIISKTGKGIAQFGADSLTSISSTIEKLGGKKVKSRIRRFFFEKSQRAARQKEAASGFVNKLQSLKNAKFTLGAKKDYNRFTYAVMNEDFDTARQIATKRKFLKEFDSVVAELKQTLIEQRKAGIKIGQIENYFPRVVKDYDGLYKYYQAKYGKDGQDFFDKKLRDYANNHFKDVRDLTAEERADILSSSLRGYGEKINIGASQATKARKSSLLEPGAFEFYHTPEEGLSIYLQRANDRIALQNILGKGTLEEGLGRLVDGLKLSPNDAAELTDNIKALLSPQGQEGFISMAVRNVATTTLLTNLSSTITNLADIALNVKDHGLLKATASLFRNKPIKKKELFETLVEDLNGKYASKFLKATGFELVDRVNVEARMGNDFRKAVRAIKAGKGKEFDDMIEKLKNSFSKEELPQVIDDFKNGKVTDLTKFHVFNQVLDISPRAISEMPLTYVKNPNLRAFYSMKSYSIKVLDIYRREVIHEMKHNKGKAIKNFVYLTTILSVAGASTDQIKNWMNGKESDFGDDVINNMLKIFFMSKYDTKTIKQDGLGRTIMEKILPPTRLFDDLTKDIIRVADENKTTGFEDLNSVRNIPVVGGTLYNSFGKGATNIEKANKKLQSPEKLAEKELNGTLTTEDQQYINSLKATDKTAYAKLEKERKLNKLGITPREKGFADMGVKDGERAEAIWKYVRGKSDAQATLAKLKKAGIITPEVAKQLQELQQQ